MSSRDQNHVAEPGQPAEGAARPVLLESEVVNLLDQFSVEPTDQALFTTLEERLFMATAWSQLAGVYECRLAALDEDDPTRPDLLVRLARLLQERLDDREQARVRFEELLRLRPEHPIALAGLRRAFAQAGDLAAALQIAELEEGLELSPVDRAHRLAEHGELWRALGDADEALRRFDQAQELDRGCEAALAGLAALAEAQGRTDDAVRYCERRVEQLSGAERARALEHLAELLPPRQEDRIRRLLREAVRHAPDQSEALERLVSIETERGAWDRVDELHRIRWSTLDGVEREDERRALALRAATAQLEGAESLDAALFWAERLDEVAPNDADAQRLRARVFRRARQTHPLIDALERLEEIAGQTPDVGLELAVLYERDGDPARAVDRLKVLATSRPADGEVLNALDRCLGRLGRDAERVEALEARVAAAATSEERGALLLEMGDLYAGPLDDYASAERTYRRALDEAAEGDPSAGRVEDRLEQLLRNGERFAELEAFLERRAEPAPRGGVGAARWCSLAVLRLTHLRDARGAREAALRGLECDPENEPALHTLRQVADAAGVGAWRIEACELELRVDPPDERKVDLLSCIVTTARELGDPLRARHAAELWAELVPEPEPFRTLAEVCRELGDTGCERRALECLETLLTAEPEARAEVFARLADMALEQPDPDALGKAAHLYRESLDLASHASVRLQLCDVLRRMGNVPDLVYELEQALETTPPREQAPLRVELARALDELGDHDGAAQALWAAFDLDPSASEVGDLLERVLARQERLDELAELLARRLSRERDPERRRALALRRAELLLDSFGRGADATLVLREWVDPSRFERFEELFERALEVSGERRELEAWLRSREPHLEGAQRLELLLRIGSLQHTLGRVHQAIETLRRAERLAPADRRDLVRGTLLSLLRAHGGSAEQLELLAGLVERSPEPAARAALRVERARILADGLRRPSEAVAELELAGEEAPLDPDGLRLLALLYRKTESLERLPGALEALAERSGEIDERVSSWLELAQLHLRGPASLRSVDEAERALREAQALAPARPEPFDLLVELYEAHGRHAELEPLFAQRLGRTELPPEHRAALALRLAQVQAAQGGTDRAIGTLEGARSAGASSPALEELLFGYLEAERDLRQRIAFCRARTEETEGEERRHWLTRWLSALEEAGEPAEERLGVVDALLAEGRRGLDLLEVRVRLLRDLGRSEPLAEALDEAVRLHPPTSARRRLYVRELLGLLEGPLGAPEQALALIEAELAGDPDLRERGARVAARVGDPARQAAILAPLVLHSGEETGAPPRPEHVRQLGLALCRTGQWVDAEPVLWRVVERQPRDREVLQALESALRRSDDGAGLLRLAELYFAFEGAEMRVALAGESFRIAEGLAQAESALVWVRRWAALADLPLEVRRRWAELERSSGDSGHQLEALRALRAHPSAESDHELRARLLAEEAAVHRARGHLEPARAAYTEAIAAQRPAGAVPPDTDGSAEIHPFPVGSLDATRGRIEWLLELDAILRALGRESERAEILRALAEHPDADVADQTRWQDERLTLLAAQPALRASAAAELAELIDAADPDDRAGRGLLVSRTRMLLALYDELCRPSDWCDFAERLLPLVSTDERDRLQREVARRLTDPLCARDRAIEHWEAILENEPADAEALGALSRLFQAPGFEGRLATVLERRCTLGDSDEAALRIDVARLRWESLGDARAALTQADHALKLDGGSIAAHAVRVDACCALGQSDREASSLRALLEADPEGRTECVRLAAERWARLAALQSRALQGLPEALSCAERALALAPTHDGVRTTARRVFELGGATERAVELLREEIEHARWEQCAGLLRRMAWIQADELRCPEAVCEALEALALVDTPAPEDEQRWAEALAARGDWADAIDHRRAALLGLGDDASSESWHELADQILEHRDDVEAAREACDYALMCNPANATVLELRAALHRRRGDARSEVTDRQRLGELLPDGPGAAAALADAARISAEDLGDVERARGLLRAALKKDESNVPALLGAGAIALERRDWSEAERMYALACTLLPATILRPRLADTARRAARAALERERYAEAFRYLEIALDEEPQDTDTLDRVADLAIRLGALPQARESLEARLVLGGLDPATRAERLRRLAQVCESQGDLRTAVDVLEDVVRLRPEDAATRERAIELMEQLGQGPRAIEQLDAWLVHARPDERAALGLRAARLEARAGQRSAARERLTGLVEEFPALAVLWTELSSLVLGDEGPTEALHICTRALEQVSEGEDRGSLLWVATQAHFKLGQLEEAAHRASETLELQPTNLEAAQMLARNLGHAGNWRVAVTRLEQSLDTLEPAAATEAELREAIGRAYAGPLENMKRAERAFRRALECNPIRTSAREALADITSFQPSAHRESLRLHRELLEAFPARPGSWRAIARIGEHWESDRVSSTCQAVLEALSGRESTGSEDTDTADRPQFLIDTGPPADPAVRAATELLRALEESDSLPVTLSRGAAPRVPAAIQTELHTLTGFSWGLADSHLKSLWNESTRTQAPQAPLARRARRRVQRELRGVPPVAVRYLDPEVWRDELLARATASAVAEGRLSLRDGLQALLQAHPQTSARDPQQADLSAATQLAPATRALLLRVVDASIEELAL